VTGFRHRAAIVSGHAVGNGHSPAEMLIHSPKSSGRRPNIFTDSIADFELTRPRLVSTKATATAGTRLEAARSDEHIQKTRMG